MRPEQLAPGDRVYRWWDSGWHGGDPQPLTVVRVNRKSVTVRTDHGGQFRMDVRDLEGFVNWEES